MDGNSVLLLRHLIYRHHEGFNVGPLSASTAMYAFYNPPNQKIGIQNLIQNTIWYPWTSRMMAMGGNSLFADLNSLYASLKCFII